MLDNLIKYVYQLGSRCERQNQIAKNAKKIVPEYLKQKFEALKNEITENRIWPKE